jgi:hypothetical protein
MQYPEGFPLHLQSAVDQALADAEAEFLTAKRRSPKFPPYTHQHAVEKLLQQYIAKVFFVFAQQACRAGAEGLWSGERMRSETDEFLHHLIVAAYYEKSPSTNRLEFFEPDVKQKIKESDDWLRYQQTLAAIAQGQAAADREVADGQADPGKDKSQLDQVEPAVLEVSAEEQTPVGSSAQAISPPGSERALKGSSSGLARKTVRRNSKYEEIDKTLRSIAESRPTSHEEVFRALDGRAHLPNAKPFLGAAGWFDAFRRNKVAARAWLSKAWSRLNLPAFPRGPK